jgi:hypothetical protein
MIPLARSSAISPVPRLSMLSVSSIEMKISMFAPGLGAYLDPLVVKTNFRAGPRR